MKAPGLNEPFTEDGFRRTVVAVRALAASGSATIGGPVALAVGATETVVPDTNCTPRSLPVLVPASAAGAAAGAWVKSVEQNKFTIGHAAAASGASLRYELRQPA